MNLNYFVFGKYYQYYYLEVGTPVGIWGIRIRAALSYY